MTLLCNLHSYEREPDVDFPIIQAPMGFGGRGELTSAVAKAGVFGFIGAGEYESWRPVVESWKYFDY